MAEDLSEYLRGVNLRVRYLHSEVATLERVQILRDLRLGEFDVLVGINLLREGLDLPEVSLVAVIDADKQGFLRSRSSLMQTAGRAARHVNGQVILYGDKISDAMEYLINESSRRRKIQENYNKDNGIEPVSIYKSTDQILGSTTVADSMKDEEPEKFKSRRGDDFSKIDKKLALDMMREEMIEAADSLDFERAAKLRDEISLIENELINVF
jgi:excinuclease ABC subunit B